MPKILVIEDDEDLRSDILEILECEGFAPIDAKNGFKGVALARKYIPDLIICDISMPGLSGYGVLLELRKTPFTAMIPFIFLTGSATKTDVRKGMEFGADDYLTKPFEVDELLSAIHTRLQKHAVIRKDATKQMDDLRLNLSHSLQHELRTPLTAILGFTQFLIHLGPDMLPAPNEIIEIQTLIQESALRLQHLTENYLLYADLKVMEYNPKSSRTKLWQGDIAPCHAQDIITSFALEKAREAGRQEDVILDLIDAEITISEKVLKKVGTELLDNAFKFSEAGNPVIVVTTMHGHQFVLQIIDQGRGMTQEQIAHIGAFRQFDRELYEQQGSGLGLTISRLLLQQHNGELIIKSIPDLGTTVNIVFNLNKS